MEILFWAAAFIWVLGFLREMACLNAQLDIRKMEYPSTEMKVAVLILMFFTWPYWHFYRKS